jgi:hypothetical protein
MKSDCAKLRKFIVAVAAFVCPACDSRGAHNATFVVSRSCVMVRTQARTAVVDDHPEDPWNPAWIERLIFVEHGSDGRPDTGEVLRSLYPDRFDDRWSNKLDPDCTSGWIVRSSRWSSMLSPTLEIHAGDEAHPRVCITFTEAVRGEERDCSVAVRALPVTVPHRTVYWKGVLSAAGLAHLSFLDIEWRREPSERPYVDRVCSALARTVGAGEAECVR